MHRYDTAFWAWEASVRRREFITVLGGVVTSPLMARAQQQRIRRIGVLLNLAPDDPETRARLAAFLGRLGELGWSDGKNLQLEYRWGMGDLDHHRKNATELVALAPDVILVHGSTIMRPLQRATATVPIVFVSVADPIAGGFIDSLARPGGNATGFTSYDYGMSGHSGPCSGISRRTTRGNFGRRTAFRSRAQSDRHTRC